MSKRVHDISGSLDLTGGQLEMVKGVVYSVLGWFTITVECFFRKDFGERYYTGSNFFIGYVALNTFLFFVALLNVWGIGSSGSIGADYYGRMFISSGYVLLSAFHFWKIWVNTQIGSPQHSVYDGKSHLQPFGSAVRKFLNPFLAIGATVLARFTLSSENFKLFKQSLDVSPIITDDEKFTKLWVEPSVLLFLFYFDSFIPSFWLSIALVSHVLFTRMKYANMRNEELDISDGLIEAAFAKDDMEGQKRFKRQMRSAAEALKERIEKEPEYADEVREDNPDLMDALDDLDIDLGFNAPKEPVKANNSQSANS